MQPKVHQGLLTAAGFRFAIVVSRWNDFLTSKLTEGALDALERLGAAENSIEIFKVPGSLELPVEQRKDDLKDDWSRDQQEKSYYYDDGYGYEVYNPDNEEDED